MRTSAALQLFLAAASAVLVSLPARPVHADEESHRYGLVAIVGGGVAGVVHPGPLPGFVGFSDLGVEILGEIRPWGGFLRGEYLSSGDDGRWTAFAFSAGTEYRLFGDPRHTALFLRGGLAYERWTGTNAGCPIDIFVPNSCNLEGAAAPSFQVTTDALGVLGGARVELPVSALYLAFSGNFVPTVAVDQSNPRATLELRFDLEIGFRETRNSDPADRSPRRDVFHGKQLGQPGE